MYKIFGKIQLVYSVKTASMSKGRGFKRRMPTGDIATIIISSIFIISLYI